MDRILKDYWKERFSDDEDNMDPPVKPDKSKECEDPEECGEDEANTIIRVVLDKLNDDWFNGTNEDKDDLDRIIDYLEPTSKPHPVMIEKAEVTKYTVEPGESYIKVSILEIDELPRTKDNVATVRPRLMEEMDKEGGALRKTGYEVAQVKLEPFKLEKMPGHRPFLKKEFDQAGDNVATASYPFLAKVIADPYAPLEVLLSKKPKSLRAKSTPSQSKSKPSSSKAANPDV
ncbi:hypothetical protein Tco_0551565 [Tanacetum coccineum]